jgi:transposase
MRKPTPIALEAQQSLVELLRKARTKEEFQRIQCIWLRASLNLNSHQVAVAIAWHPNSVKKLQAQYLRQGEAVLRPSKSGGRYRQNMTLEEEGIFLAPFLEKAQTGGVIVATEIKVAYEIKAGRKVPKSTIYRMLARHGWRKISPRSRHPKKNVSLEDEFKKNFPKS